MDARNDDSSGGSDSLDKSLQLKCVVDDVGQGEGKQAENNINEAASSNIEHISDINNKSQHNKTEQSIGDCGGGGSNGGGGGGAETSTVAAVATVDALNKRACDDITTTTTTNNADERNFIENNHNNNNNNNNNSNNSNNNNNAFESKVKQISKDLKETTLAEYNTTTTPTTTNESNATVLRSLSASSSSTSSTSGGGSDQLEQSEQLNVSDSTDDTRSKKVRFHPDVKENDGGNRVIRKKKKKLKKGSAGEESGLTTESAQSAQGADDDMDFEEEEEEETVEEEEEFNLAKTIAEAQNYLKLHPLTFVKSNNAKSGLNMPEDAGKRLQNGLLQEEDLPLLSESSEEEDFYEEIIPECGVERILGKQVRNGKTLLLVRYVNDDGLFWESEERIASMCPTMMSKYEINRERRQERLMRHVAKRQNLRQRYTDF